VDSRKRGKGEPVSQMEFSPPITIFSTFSRRKRRGRKEEGEYKKEGRGWWERGSVRPSYRSQILLHRLGKKGHRRRRRGKCPAIVNSARPDPGSKKKKEKKGQEKGEPCDQACPKKRKEISGKGKSGEESRPIYATSATAVRVPRKKGKEKKNRLGGEGKEEERKTFFDVLSGCISAATGCSRPAAREEKKG